MQITLNQDEITAAVEMYVRSQISIQATQTISIDFTMGRSGNGLSASLDIKPAVPFAKPTYRGGERQAVAERPQPTVTEDDPDDGVSVEEAAAPISKTSIFKGGNDDTALDEVEEETSGETEEASETEEPSPPKRSLFSKAG